MVLYSFCNFRVYSGLVFWSELWSGKNRRLSSIFDSCWKNEVSNFCLGQFGKVELFCEPNEPDVDINNINSNKHQAHSVHKMAQLSQIAPSKNWKPRFSSMSQKLKIVFNFFPDYGQVCMSIVEL